MARTPASHQLDVSDDPDESLADAASAPSVLPANAATSPQGRVGPSSGGPPVAAATAGAAPATGAEALLLTAVQYGVDVCFANPGTTEMWMVAAMDKLWPAVRPVLCLHENVATGAADGYARIARQPALTLLHLGPGLANGLANLHNARRARSPVVNLVGDMATWHRANDPPLNSPLEWLAAAVSGCVLVSGVRPRSASPCHGTANGGVGDGGDGAARRLALALAAALEGAGPAAAEGPAATPAAVQAVSEVRPVGGSVVTVIVPHDLSWDPPPPSPSSPPSSDPGTRASCTGHVARAPASPGPVDPDALTAAEAFVSDCASALMTFKSRRNGGSAAAAAAAAMAALYLGGEALLAEDGALLAAGQIAAVTGAALLCEGAFARADRGAGLPALRRLPYFPQEAASELARYGCLVLVDAKPPVANFGYKGAPGRLLARDDDPSSVWEFDPAALAAAGWTAATALRRLAAALGPAAAAVRPLVNCGGVFTPPRRPAVPPPGRLTPAALCAVLAALQPEGAVVVDESLTSGSSYWEVSKGCPPFVHLTLTGGAIGSGPPMALGAAMALAAAEKRGGGGAAAAGAEGPQRRVINLQADGSAMYSLQALWSQAREQLPVTTIICANSSYAILRVEAARQRLPGVGPATRALTDLSSPRLDWVSLAAGMGVPGARVDSVERLARELEAALVAPGPFLIQADMA